MNYILKYHEDHNNWEHENNENYLRKCPICRH